MIITCASCLTKFNLDDSRISSQGVKVRCSRCKHVFYVVPPPETREEIIEGFQSFAKYHEELMGPGEKKLEGPPEAEVKKEEGAPEEEAFLFSEKPPAEKAEKSVPPKKREEPAVAEKVETLPPLEREEKILPEEPVRARREEEAPSRRRSALRAEKRGPSRFLALVVVLILVVFAVFYVWSELSSGGRLSPYLDYPVKKATELWNQIWGVEKEDLIVGDLGGYEEKIGDVTLSVIEGKVKNQSQFTKKYIKVRVMIFDRDKLKVAEKEAICGKVLDREELKKQPVEFFRGDMVVKPEAKQEMVPSGKTTPFMVIFKDPPSQAKEFKVEIVEAPNL